MSPQTVQTKTSTTIGDEETKTPTSAAARGSEQAADTTAHSSVSV